MRDRALWLCTVFAAALATAGAAHAAPKSIFDDDWTPPKAVTPPPADPAKTAKPPPSDPPVTPPPSDPPAKRPEPASPPVPPIPAPTARLPVPDRAKQAEVRKILREVFAEQLADATPPARRKLAERLLAQAADAADAPVDRFVLLAAAVEAATDGGALPLAFRAADEMGLGFEVDALALKAEAVPKLNARAAAAPAAAADQNGVAALAVVVALADADDFAGASRVLAAVQPLAASDPRLRADVQRLTQDVAAARAAREQVSRHVVALMTTPDDPAANLAVGQYLCFVKGDWAAGLPKLARGSDAKLKALADQEATAPDSADARAALADAWWELAATAAPAHKLAMSARAAAWYEQAVPGLKALTKARAEKRVEQARAAVAAAGPGFRRPSVASGTSELVVEALIDGHSTLHLTPAGLFWEHHANGSRPGRADPRAADQPTFVNGKPWVPVWGKADATSNDRTDVYPLPLGNDPDFRAEVVATGPKPGGNTNEPRKPVTIRAGAGEALLVFKDDVSGAGWYRVRLTRVVRHYGYSTGGDATAGPAPAPSAGPRVVLWNTHNGPYRDRGVGVCDVSLFKGPQLVWSAKDVRVPWKHDAPVWAAVDVPATVAFDRVRVDVTEPHGRSAGLAEVEVYVNGRNVAAGCRVTTDSTYPNMHPGLVVDGITEDNRVKGTTGYWLHDKPTGYLELHLNERAPGRGK